MGRYVYESGRVQSSLNRLGEAKNLLNETQAELQKAFNTLASARGIEWIDYASSQGSIEGLPGDCQQYIQALYDEIKNKSKQIDDYNNKPWYEKIFASLCMGVAKVVEGIAVVGENIVDAGASLVGFTAGIFGNKEFQDSCGEFIKKDHVGDAFNYMFYDENGLTGGWMEKASLYSSESTFANVLKGVGTAAGYIALGAATGGALGVSATAANTGVAIVGGLGAGTETGLQQGKDFNSAFVQGVKQAAIQGGTAYVAGKIGEKIVQNGPKQVQGKHAKITGKHANPSTLYENSFTNTISNAGDDIATKAVDKALNVGNKISNSKIGQTATNITQKVANSSAGQHVGQIVEGATGLADDALNVGKNIVGKVGSTGVGKVATNLTSKAVNAGGKMVNGFVNVAAKNPVVGNVVSAGLVTAPIMSNTMKQANIGGKDLSIDTSISTGNVIDPGDIATPEVFTRETPGETPAQTQNTQTEQPAEAQNSTPQANNNGGGYQSQGSVAYRQASTPSAPISTPSYTAPNTTPTQTPTEVPSVGKVDLTNPVPTTPNTPQTPQTPSILQTPSTPQVPQTPQVPSTPQSPQGPSSTTTGSSGTSHSGGGYSNGGYSFGGSTPSTGTTTPQTPADIGGQVTAKGTLASSINNIASGQNQTIKVPTIDTPISSGSSSNMAIPTAAALSAAAAAGIGTKAYMDYKTNNKNEDEYEEGNENSGFTSEEWNGTEEDIKLDYGTENQNQYLDSDDDYSYSADSIIEKYEAVNNN